MKPERKLVFVKLLHTLVWVVMAAAVVYLVAASLLDRFDPWFWAAAVLIGGETLVLLISGFKCPLTTVAERYTEDREPDFDIYLPRWLARYNVLIFSTILGLGLLANLLLRLL